MTSCGLGGGRGGAATMRFATFTLAVWHVRLERLHDGGLTC